MKLMKNSIGLSKILKNNLETSWELISGKKLKKMVP